MVEYRPLYKNMCAICKQISNQLYICLNKKCKCWYWKVSFSCPYTYNNLILSQKTHYKHGDGYYEKLIWLLFNETYVPD